MKEIKNLGPEPESLEAFTIKECKAPVINWYRSPLSRDAFKSLHEKSDLRGAIQALGYLGMLISVGALAFYSFYNWSWFGTVALVFLYGMVSAFLINGVHELGHGTVFKTKWLNHFFCYIFSFLGWINHEMFHASHSRHHRYTLHAPDDLEVVLPIRLMIRHFIYSGFVDPVAAWRVFKYTLRIARGHFVGEWELTLFPASAPKKRQAPIRWARFLLLGHGLVIAVGIVTGQWLLPILVTFAPFYGSWLFFLCNNTQHIGLQDFVPDFRLCCRTFTLNPVISFLYWRMNYHTEHHMYAAVPCYNLGRLHKLIKHDLPPCPHGLIAVWTEIADIQRNQEKDPAYIHPIKLPPPSPISS